MRGLPHNHLKQDDSDRVNVGLERVAILLERFGGHIERRSHIDPVLEGKPALNRKTKIRYFPLVSRAEDVGRLDISVNHALRHQIPVSAADLTHYFQSIALSQLPLLRDVLAQTAVGTVLENEVIVV